MNFSSQEEASDKMNFQKIQDEPDLFQASTQLKDLFQQTGQDLEDTYQHVQYQAEEQLVFSMFSQGCYKIFNTKEKLISYLDTFVLSLLDRPIRQELMSPLAFYKSSPWSFLNILAENCMILLYQAKCERWLIPSTIFTAMLMMEQEKYELFSRKNAVDTQRLFHF